MCESGRESGQDLDDALMGRVAEVADRPAYELLLRRNLRRAVAVAQGICGNASDADEIVQEAFLRVWQHAERWQPGRARFTTWLHRIVVNLCLDRRRKPVWLPIESAGEVPVSDDTAAPEMILRRQRRDAVARAMGGISQRQRAALTLFYFDGLSGREAAEVMGCSLAAFEQLLLRARRAVKAELAKIGDWGGGWE